VVVVVVLRMPELTLEVQETRPALHRLRVITVALVETLEPDGQAVEEVDLLLSAQTVILL
jgi:hypothetical protein